MGMHLGLVRPSGKRVLVTERFGEGQVGEDLFFCRTSTSAPALNGQNAR